MIKRVNTSSNKYRTGNKQSGAALVVALILLVALSLMAIASMNTASLDLIMAGNEQYRSRSFETAEASIQQAWNLPSIAYDSSSDYGSGGTVPGSIVTSGLGNDKFTYTITRPGNGKTEGPPAGYSAGGPFGAIHFRITATGASERGTNSTHMQELLVVVPSGYDPGCDTTLTTCTLD